jgi:uncharacterized integral membrane protein
MMIIICALVWGGFIAFLAVVWRIEKMKARMRAEDGTGED